MTTPNDGSARLTGPADTASGTTASSRTASGADVTSRMTGTSTVRPGTGNGTATHKTSAAAAFALVFGLAALFCALTGILAPAAVLFGLIGLVLGIAGLKMSKRPGVTGKGVATGGLVTAVLGLLLGAGVLAGLAVAVNNESNLNRISDFVDSARDKLPSGQQLERGAKNAVN